LLNIYCCHFFVVWFCHVFFIPVLRRHFFGIFLSFSHPARVAGSGAELQSPKTQFHQHASHLFVICLSFFVVSLSFFVVFCHPLRFPDWESFLKDFCAFSRSQNDNKVTKKNTTK